MWSDIFINYNSSPTSMFYLCGNVFKFFLLRISWKCKKISKTNNRLVILSLSGLFLAAILFSLQGAAITGLFVVGSSVLVAFCLQNSLTWHLARYYGISGQGVFRAIPSFSVRFLQLASFLRKFSLLSPFYRLVRYQVLLSHQIGPITVFNLFSKTAKWSPIVILRHPYSDLAENKTRKYRSQSKIYATYLL